jgi:hypothetical protein
LLFLSERRNTRNTRDRLLEEQNAAYLDSVRADQEKVCYFEKKRLIKESSF